jgi:hypothetical protein
VFSAHIRYYDHRMGTHARTPTPALPPAPAPAPAPAPSPAAWGAVAGGCAWAAAGSAHVNVYNHARKKGARPVAVEVPGT